MDGLGGGDSLGQASGSIELRADGAMRALDQVGRGLQNLDRQSTGFGSGWARSIQGVEGSLTAVGTGLAGIGLGRAITDSS